MREYSLNLFRWLKWVLTLKQPDHTGLLEEISPGCIERELENE